MEVQRNPLLLSGAELIAHLEIEADIPSIVSGKVLRDVPSNARPLKLQTAPFG
jgi:hypothetical protein